MLTEILMLIETRSNSSRKFVYFFNTPNESLVFFQNMKEDGEMQAIVVVVPMNMTAIIVI